MAIKVSIYEDNTALLERLSHLIRGVEDFELCTASRNAVNILSDCRNKCPDVILMDSDMPEISDIEATWLVRNEFPEVNVMILAVFEDENKIFKALRAGVRGYLLKKITSIEIIKAIREVYNGGSPMSSSITRKVLGYFSNLATEDLAMEDLAMEEKQDKYLLTRREKEILQYLKEGYSYKKLAEACFITIGTVYSHINNIYKKLQVNSKLKAVAKATAEKLV